MVLEVTMKSQGRRRKMKKTGEALKEWGDERCNGGILTFEDVTEGMDLATLGTLSEHSNVTNMVAYFEQCVHWETGGQKEEWLDKYYNVVAENQRKESMRTTGA